jgi:predicted ATPase
MPHISAVELDLLNGALVGQLKFHENFNIIVGENGTGKTRLLEHIKNQRNTLTLGGADQTAQPLRIQVINPKRNMERKTSEALFTEFRRQTKTPEQQTAEQSVNWSSFAAYPTFGDLYFSRYETLARLPSRTPQQNMEQVTAELNAVVIQIFEKYKIQATWMEAQGRPNVQIAKNNSRTVVDLEALSTGEQEILSLAAYLTQSVGKYDVFLVDEPKVHLNWSLEKKLFEFLELFAFENNIQLIIVSHSRAALQSKYRKYCSFLMWTDANTVSITKELSHEQSLLIAGEALDLLVQTRNDIVRFVVEDEAQKLYIQALGKILDVPTDVILANNKQNVRTFYNFVADQDPSAQVFFLMDSDNQGSDIATYPKVFISEGYCYENYLLKPSLLSAMCGNKTEQEVREVIVNCIHSNPEKVLKLNKHIEFLLAGLNSNNLTDERLMKFDASAVLKSTLEGLGIASREFEKKFLENAFEMGKAELVCSPKLLAFLKNKKQDILALPVATSDMMGATEQSGLTSPLSSHP